MVVPPDARSAILNLTESELEQQIVRAEHNIEGYEASIKDLNDRIAEQRRFINDLILPGRVYETPLYQQRYGNNRQGLQFREGDILAQYQDTIRDESNLIGAANNAINLEEAKITNRRYDLDQLRRNYNKPTKSANKRMPQPESEKTNKKESKSPSKGGGKKTNKKKYKKGSKKTNKKGSKKTNKKGSKKTNKKGSKKTNKKGSKKSRNKKGTRKRKN